jgi:hypothetical protein
LAVGIRETGDRVKPPQAQAVMDYDPFTT